METNPPATPETALKESNTAQTPSSSPEVPQTSPPTKQNTEPSSQQPHDEHTDHPQPTLPQPAPKPPTPDCKARSLSRTIAAKQPEKEPELPDDMWLNTGDGKKEQEQELDLDPNPNPDPDPDPDPNLEQKPGPGAEGVNREDVGDEGKGTNDAFAAINLISKELEGLDIELGGKIESYTQAKEDEVVRNDVELAQNYFRSPTKPAGKSGSPNESGLYSSKYVGPYKTMQYSEPNPLAGYLAQPMGQYGRQGLELSTEQYAQTLRQEAERYRQRESAHRTEGNPLARPLPKSHEELVARGPPIPGKVIYSKPAESPPQLVGSYAGKPGLPLPTKTTPPYRPYAPN